jgi:predicted NAD/FAD-binding protein
MRIGIIGGGAAGLTSTWLLHDQHEVTLFERQTRFGGHAHTVEVEDDGARVPVEAGSEFFSRRLAPRFNRLLAELDVELRDYPMRIGITRAGQGRTLLLQPIRLDGRFSPGLLRARKLSDVTQFGLVLARVAPLMRAQDTSLTIEQVLRRLPLTRSFRDELLFPLLLSGWCVEPDDFREFAAYTALRYVYTSLSLRGAVAMQEVVGGMRCYVAAVLRQIPRAVLRQPADIASIDRESERFTVRERGGRTHVFDHLVLATNARAAAVLLEGVRGAEKVQSLLASIDYFPTRIAVHGDPRVMPADAQAWSIVNVRYDGTHAQTTVWKPWRSARLFRSWITYDAEMPDHVHALVTFEHARPTCRYFETQRALNALQGDAGVWLAGNYMHDVDNHESAVVSAIRVAERLAPAAPRLATLRAPVKTRF